jgi:hypothetical protein
MEAENSDWLALIHQLPTKPPYLRVKIWRRLQAIGAVPLKNAVHVLPPNNANERAFRELLAEIIECGGEATLIRARLLAGQTDSQLQGIFDGARDCEYNEVVRAAQRLAETGPPTDAEVAKLRKRLQEIVALDFYGVHGRQAASAALATLDRQRSHHPDVGHAGAPPTLQALDLHGKTWVTRRGVHVDRIACAWLIRRAIDPAARFKFVDGRSHTPAAGELRFDMADAEFTHEGGRCSFETLMLRAGLVGDPGLDAIAEIIHDLDLGDNKYGRPETAGLGAMLSGICASTDDDLQRIAIGSDVLNQFCVFFSSGKVGR